MRICMVTSCYPRHPGDATAGGHVQSLACHLAAEQKMDVTVLAPAIAGLPAVESDGGVTVRRLRYFWPAAWQKLAYGAGIPWNLKRSPLAWLNVPWFLLAYVVAVVRFGRKSDVIHAHWGPLGTVAVLTRPLHRKPVVLTVHGSDLRSPLKLLRAVSRFGIRRADVVITLSQQFLDACRALRGGRDGCVLVRHGVDAPDTAELRRLREQAPRRGALRIVTVGRLIPERRHELLISAFARLLDSAPGSTLTIVGDGPQAHALLRHASAIGVERQVCFTGRVAAERVAEFLTDADVYVSPTTVETFGLAVMEAAMFALPVVTTAVGFPAELVLDGRTGFVVPPDEEEALFHALRRLAEPGSDFAAMGWAMRTRAEGMGFTWSNVARTHAEEVYRVLYNPAAGPRRRWQRPSPTCVEAPESTPKRF